MSVSCLIAYKTLTTDIYFLFHVNFLLIIYFYNQVSKQFSQVFPITYLISCSGWYSQPSFIMASWCFQSTFFMLLTLQVTKRSYLAHMIHLWGECVGTWSETTCLRQQGRHWKEKEWHKVVILLSQIESCFKLYSYSFYSRLNSLLHCVSISLCVYLWFKIWYCIIIHGLSVCPSKRLAH